MNLHLKDKTTQNEMRLLDDKIAIENNRKAMELNSRLEDKKRSDYTKDRLDDLKLKNKKVQFDREFKVKDTEEAKQMMNDYSLKELQRENEYREKFNNINRNMEKNINNFNQNVLKANLQRQTSQQLKETQAINEYKQKMEKDYINQVTQHKSQVMDTNSVIQQQLYDKKHTIKLNDQVFNYESSKVKEKVQEIMSVDEQMREEKKKRQLMYRDMLGSQIQFNQNIKLQGTMTAVEKQLNKVDLKAYKQGNKSVHSFIPGINHSNFGTQSKFNTNKKKTEEKDLDRENIRRMEMFGYSRGYSNINSSNRLNQTYDQPLGFRTESRHKHNNSMLTALENNNPIEGSDLMLSPTKTFEKSPVAKQSPEISKLDYPMQNASIDYGQQSFDRRKGRAESGTVSAFKRAGIQSLERTSLNGIL